MATRHDGTAGHDPHTHEAAPDPACAAAHGDLDVPVGDRLLVAVFASPVAAHLLHFGQHLGWGTVLLDPDPSAIPADLRAAAGAVAVGPSEARLGPSADVVVTDHDRPELGDVLAGVLAYETRWVGVMGSLRHTAPHVAALADRGVPEADVARVHRPVGLNIGSRTPAEIAVATLAGLLADRQGRPGGFTFAPPVAAEGRAPS